MADVAVDVEESTQELSAGENQNDNGISQVSETERPNGNETYEMISRNEDQQREALKALLNLLQNDTFFLEFFLSLTEALEIEVDINHPFAEQENKTLLDIACSNTNRALYVELLLKEGADVNRLNPKLGVAPIHLAVSSSDFDTVQVLVEYKDTDIYQENSAGKTAFHLAAEHKKRDFIQLLQKRQADDIELSKKNILINNPGFHQYFCDLICRYNHRFHSTLEYNTRREYIPEVNLFQSILDENYEAFASEANERNVKLEDNNLPFTYLQLTCRLGLTNFVEFLLNLNVLDPNETVESDRETPIAIAAFHGYHNIVQLLVDTGIIIYHLPPPDPSNVLHHVLEGFLIWEFFIRVLKSERNIDDHKDHLKCLKLFLNNIPDKLFHTYINSQEIFGQTPLYLAIYNDKREIILLLLERGAYIGAPARGNQPVVQIMKPDTLKYFLDQSMFHEWKAKDNVVRVKLNYNLLTPSYQNINVSYIDETKLLLTISEVPELKPLLTHPLFLVFLDFKWHIIMFKLYCINLIIYIPFVLFLSIYLFAFNNVTLKNNGTLAFAFWLILLLFNCGMFLRFIIQSIIDLKVYKYRYFTNIENYLQGIPAIFTFIILGCDIFLILGYEIQLIQIKAFLATLAIFLSYVELMLLILSHPSRCVRIEMLKAVARNAFTLLLSYLLLILAFALSFYMLFKDASTNTTSTNTTNTTTTKTSSFNSITQAFIKTLLMSIGEYDLSDILTDDEYHISRWVVVLFIFLIPIVLFNLLNAVAVGDIKKITKEAELVSVISRVKQIIHLEETSSALYSFRGRWLRWACYNTEHKRYSWTNYFDTSNYEKYVAYYPSEQKCRIHKRDSVPLEFSASPFTVKAFAEKLSAKVGEEFEDDTLDTTTKVAQEAATSQKLCQNQETLKDTLEKMENKFQETLKDTLEKLENKFQETSKDLLEKLENRFQIMEQKLTGSTGI